MYSIIATAAMVPLTMVKVHNPLCASLLVAVHPIPISSSAHPTSLLAGRYRRKKHKRWLPHHDIFLLCFLWRSTAAPLWCFNLSTNVTPSSWPQPRIHSDLFRFHCGLWWVRVLWRRLLEANTYLLCYRIEFHVPSGAPNWKHVYSIDISLVFVQHTLSGLAHFSCDAPVVFRLTSLPQTIRDQHRIHWGSFTHKLGEQYVWCNNIFWFFDLEILWKSYCAVICMRGRGSKGGIGAIVTPVGYEYWLYIL